MFHVKRQSGAGGRTCATPCSTAAVRPRTQCSLAPDVVSPLNSAAVAARIRCAQRVGGAFRTTLSAEGARHPTRPRITPIDNPVLVPRDAASADDTVRYTSDIGQRVPPAVLRLHASSAQCGRLGPVKVGTLGGSDRTQHVSRETPTREPWARQSLLIVRTINRTLMGWRYTSDVIGQRVSTRGAATSRLLGSVRTTRVR